MQLNVKNYNSLLEQATVEIEFTFKNFDANNSRHKIEKGVSFGEKFLKLISITCKA